jgi:CheY-like chemotaxis protein
MPGRTVLIVEDNPINLKMVQVSLKAAGYRVLAANSGEDALNSLRTTHPDIIVTDLQLPGIGGLELTRRIKANIATRHIYVIALTAYSMVENEEQARQAGCDDYITKPVSPRLLTAKISEYLASTQGS